MARRHANYDRDLFRQSRNDVRAAFGLGLLADTTLPWNTNLMVRQPYGSDEELKAILLSHSPPGYG